MFRCQASRRMLERASSIRTHTHIPHPSIFSAPRQFTSTSIIYARKDTQDKDSINTASNEYSKSGSDDDASSSGAAFDPNQTSPESEYKRAENEGGGNSLDMSASNPEVSKPRGDQEGGAAKSPSGKSSGGGSPQKGGTDAKHS